MTTRRFPASDNAALDLFYKELAAGDLQPLWLQDPLATNPPARDLPFLWEAKHLRELGERAVELVPIDRGGDRRVLSLCNPGLGGLPYATTTLCGAMQYLGPGEVAPAHRHTPGALRFVVEGSGVWTLVNGDPIAMSAGDLILTPSMCWHEHHNPGTSPMAWFDGLDVPLVRSLDATFYEPGPDEAVNRAVDPMSASERRWALGPGLVPVDSAPTSSRSPLLAYRWSDTDRALTRMIGGADDGRAAIRFVQPATGDDVMPTLRCEMHRLEPGHGTPTSRRTGSSVWVVFNGAVTAVIAGRRFAASVGDIFVVPSWASFDLAAGEPSDLFCLSDEPVMEACGLARKETLPGHQEVS